MDGGGGIGVELSAEYFVVFAHPLNSVSAYDNSRLLAHHHYDRSCDSNAWMCVQQLLSTSLLHASKVLRWVFPLRLRFREQLPDTRASESVYLPRTAVAGCAAQDLQQRTNDIKSHGNPSARRPNSPTSSATSRDAELQQPINHHPLIRSAIAPQRLNHERSYSYIPSVHHPVRNYVFARGFQ